MKHEKEPWMDALRSDYQPNPSTELGVGDDFHDEVILRVKRRQAMRITAVVGCAILIGLMAATTKQEPATELRAPQIATATLELGISKGEVALLDAYEALITEDANEGSPWGTAMGEVNDSDLDDYIAGQLEPSQFENWTTSADSMGGELDAIAQLITMIDRQETL